MAALTEEMLEVYPNLTPEIMEKFEFETEAEFFWWSQTLTFRRRIYWDNDDEPGYTAEFVGWPEFLVTDGDNGVALLQSSSDKGVHIQPISPSYFLVSFEDLRAFQECYEIAASEFDRLNRNQE